MLSHLLDTPVPPKKVVVIGATGFVGSAICRHLKSRGIAYVPLTRAELDLSADGADERLLSFLDEGDSVVAAAARAPCRNLEMLRENISIVRTLVGAFRKVRIAHLINISSDAVYADGPLPLTEASPTAPGSYHGLMHLAREIALKSELTSPLAILRPTLLYGEDDPHNGYGPNRFRRLAQKGEVIELFGAGEERRDHVFIDDLADIAVRILLRKSVGTLNVATGTTHSFRQIAEMLVDGGSRSLRIRELPRQGPMPHGGYRPFDNGATKAAFADFSYVSLPTGLQRLKHNEQRTT